MEALIHGIKEADDPRFREQLEGAYMSLSEWQVGFGKRRASAELTDEELKDPAKALARITAAAGDFLKVPQEVAVEAAQLQADLKTRELA